MTSGMLFALAISALVVAVFVGLMRRQRLPGAGKGLTDGPSTTAQWTEGETTRLLSSAELPGLYLLRPRFLSKAENVVYLLLKAAFPRHEIFARVRLADVLQVKIGPQGMERLRAFRKIANQHVGFVVCDRAVQPDDGDDRAGAGAAVRTAAHLDHAAGCGQCPSTRRGLDRDRISSLLPADRDHRPGTRVDGNIPDPVIRSAVGTPVPR